MADVTQPRNISANGTATPATATLSGVVSPDFLVCVIAVLGTSPTIATPTGDAWVQIQKTQGATLSFAVYFLAGASNGSHTPSAVLGGTVTGWICEVFEFTAMPANAGQQGSFLQASATSNTISSLFPGGGNTLYSELFFYAVARATATYTPVNTWNVPNVAWSSSVLPQSGVQGLSLDFFWASNLGQGVGQYPAASGTLGASVACAAIAAWFNSSASQPSSADIVSGVAGTYVGGQFQGIIGG